jgi:hypothetical protein
VKLVNKINLYNSADSAPAEAHEKGKACIANAPRAMSGEEGVISPSPIVSPRQQQRKQQQADKRQRFIQDTTPVPQQQL